MPWRTYCLDRLLEAVRRLRDERPLRLVSEVLGVGAPPGVALVRFDVERDLPHHLVVAERLAADGVRATFYCHSRPGVYEAAGLRRLEALGHEVGYHHECLDRCGGDVATARDLFLRECDRFRQDGLRLRTVCSHGEAGLRRRGHRHNWELFVRDPALLPAAGLQGEVYLWLAEAAPRYASDTFARLPGLWRTLDASRGEATPLMLLAHLHRWRDRRRDASREVLRDLSSQLARRARGLLA